MKLLITGGAGFIGGNFIHYLLEKFPEYQIFNLDSLTYAGDLAKHKAIERNKNYTFIKGDITDQSCILTLFKKEKFDNVIHFAAESHVDRSIRDPQAFLRTNVLGTQVLLEAARQHDVAKFIHVSTDEVYGELDLHSSELFTEKSPIQPNSPYSASKASSDFLARSYHVTYGLPVIITRCSNNYGPYQFPEKLIPLAISRLLTNQTVPVYGNGQNIRDWLHVYDHCKAIDVIMHHGDNGEVYNIGGHNERTNLEVVKTIINQLGKHEGLIEYVPDRLGHDQRYAIDPTKLERLGWVPSYTFEWGMEQTVRWYIDHQDWWKPLSIKEC